MPQISLIRANRAFSLPGVDRHRALIFRGAMAGLAGGFAEVVWIGLYSVATGTNGFEVARHVADAVFPGVLSSPFAPTLGLVIHFALSIGLGLVFVLPLELLGRRRPAALLPAGLVLLAAVWCINFLIILPIVSPVFPALLPVWVTLGSKLGFGAALAIALRHMSAEMAD
jgi:hypothetical protein